jgi:hypothetical protein
MGAANLTYVLEGSTNLLTWSPLCTITGTNPPGGPGFISETGTGYLRQVQARDIAAVETTPAARFVRFKLVQN